MRNPDGFMVVAKPPSPNKTRSSIRTLWNFAMIGALGFVTEAIILTALVQAAHWLPWHARVPSFLTAVLLTWLLNRRHTFAGREPGCRGIEALSYMTIQICGAAINLAIFGVCLASIPALVHIPVVPLGIGAVAGFAFNFAASNLLLYRRRTQHRA